MLLATNWFFLEYAIPVGFACVLALLSTAKGRIEFKEEREKYYCLQAITLVSAVIGGKLAVAVGDFGWPILPGPDLHDLLYSGRSLTGALLFGFLGSEIAKPMFKYRSRPNDRFAVTLMLSVALGRVGCLMAGCCRGSLYEGPLALRYPDESFSRFPAPVLEMVFHLAVGAYFWMKTRQGKFQGQVFARYLIAYGVFRFFSEFERDTPKLIQGFSYYQAFAALLVVCGVASLRLRSKSRLQLDLHSAKGDLQRV